MDYITQVPHWVNLQFHCLKLPRCIAHYVPAIFPLTFYKRRYPCNLVNFRNPHKVFDDLLKFCLLSFFMTVYFALYINTLSNSHKSYKHSLGTKHSTKCICRLLEVYKYITEFTHCLALIRKPETNKKMLTISSHIWFRCVFSRIFWYFLALWCCYLLSLTKSDSTAKQVYTHQASWHNL